MLDLILDQNSLIFQWFSALILKHAFICVYERFLMICLYLRYAKITFLLQKNNYFHGFTCILKVMIFIVVLCIFAPFWRYFLTHFRTFVGYSFVHRFLIVFWSKNDAQNQPKITPKSTPVRPRAASGFLASSGHLWTCHFYDFWCQNGSQNDLKII